MSMSMETEGLSRPPLAGDILRGAKEIARFVWGNDNARFSKRVYRSKTLPVFRMDTIICARKSTLEKWIAEQEANGGRPVKPGR